MPLPRMTFRVMPAAGEKVPPVTETTPFSSTAAKAASSVSNASTPNVQVSVSPVSGFTKDAWSPAIFPVREAST